MAGGMSAECPEPGPGGAQGQSPGPGRQCPPPITPAPWSLPRWRAYVAAAVLCYINLLNYMNWFIIAGVLLDVQEVFQISDSHAGLLQTVFIGCLLLSAPVFGYLGDRYSRKTTMSFGILLWSGAGLSSSFISSRIMPCLEAVALILLILLVPDPPRGAAETQREAAGGSRSSWCEDVRYLGKNWSFVWSTLGVTAMAFVTGALGFWAPKFLLEARVVHGLQPPCFQEPCSNPDSLIFGSLTIMTGVIGVILGAEAARRYKKVIPRAEPLICASSLLATAPCLYLALVLAPTTLLASYVTEERSKAQIGYGQCGCCLKGDNPGNIKHSISTSHHTLSWASHSGRASHVGTPPSQTLHASISSTESTSSSFVHPKILLLQDSTQSQLPPKAFPDRSILTPEFMFLLGLSACLVPMRHRGVWGLSKDRGPKGRGTRAAGSRCAAVSLAPQSPSPA
nr:protein spinster homolog 3 isoform X4 [Macaca nemestrina]